jgi:hypothetical protein
VAASPTTIATHKGWGSTQSLAVFIILLLGVLVFAPGLVARNLDRRRSQ